jgi:hypothetical protein
MPLLTHLLHREHLHQLNLLTQMFYLSLAVVEVVWEQMCLIAQAVAVVLVDCYTTQQLL